MKAEMERNEDFAVLEGFARNQQKSVPPTETKIIRNLNPKSDKFSYRLNFELACQSEMYGLTSDFGSELENILITS